MITTQGQGNVRPSRVSRLRVRTDLIIKPQRYEGRRYYVVKDPIGLRYFRFHEEEYFLLRQINGKRSLEEVQEAFEARFRPQKVTVEQLEGFVAHLFEVGLA